MVVLKYSLLQDFHIRDFVLPYDVETTNVEEVKLFGMPPPDCPGFTEESQELLHRRHQLNGKADSFLLLQILFSLLKATRIKEKMFPDKIYSLRT